MPGCVRGDGGRRRVLPVRFRRPEHCSTIQHARGCGATCSPTSSPRQGPPRRRPAVCSSHCGEGRAQEDLDAEGGGGHPPIWSPDQDLRAGLREAVAAPNHDTRRVGVASQLLCRGYVQRVGAAVQPVPRVSDELPARQ